MENKIRKQLVECGKILYQRGYSSGTAGNISARLSDGNILATPTNSCLGELDPESLAVVTPDGIQVSGNKMSKEIPFHLALYRTKPDCAAVIHLHSTWLTALSCRSDLNPRNVIRPFTPYYVMKVGEMPLIPYYRPGSPLIGEALMHCKKGIKAFLLANHGPVMTGKSLDDAMQITEELEETARLMFLLRDLPVRYLTEEEIEELR